MKPWKEVIDGIRNEVLGKEVREDIAQMGEYVEQFANTAGENIQKAIDPTLSLAGKAADAKATGDAIGELKEDLDHLDSDIIGLATGSIETANVYSPNVILKTSNGITISKNEDGTYRFSGTATSSMEFMVSNDITGINGKHLTYYSTYNNKSFYLIGNLGPIKKNDAIWHLNNGDSIDIPSSVYKFRVVIWVKAGTSYDFTFSFCDFFEGNVSKNINIIANKNIIEKKKEERINKVFNLEPPFTEENNILSDSLFNNRSKGLSKNGNHFLFNNVTITGGIYNSFDSFTLSKGEYTLLIDTECKITYPLFFSIQNDSTSVNKAVSLRNDRTSNYLKFSIDSDCVISKAGFFTWDTPSYTFSGDVRVALVIGNETSFDYNYKIDERVSRNTKQIESLSKRKPNVVFFDDFNNPTINKNVWGIENGCTRNQSIEAQYYLDRNVSIENGCLKLSAKRENYIDKTWTSGAVQSIKGVQFGVNTRITAKIKLENCGDGAWPAFWSYGGQYTQKRQNWPINGEIDIFECWKSGGSGYARTTLHYSSAHNMVHNNIPMSLMNNSEWHTWCMEWINDSITIKCDDDVIKSFDTSMLLDNDYACYNDKTLIHRIVFDLAIDMNKLSDNTPSEMYMYVDYVKVENIGEIQRSNYLQFENNSISCEVGDEFYSIAVTDIECSDKSVYWSIEDESIIIPKYKNNSDKNSFESIGKFIALKSGTTKIKVKDKYGNSDICVVTVN